MMTPPQPLLSLDRPGVAFWQGALSLRPRRRFWVLQEISSDLYQGETLGIIGRNAAGKSTLLRLIAGIIRQDRGLIRYEGPPGVCRRLSGGPGYPADRRNTRGWR